MQDELVLISFKLHIRLGERAFHSYSSCYQKTCTEIRGVDALEKWNVFWRFQGIDQPVHERFWKALMNVMNSVKGNVNSDLAPATKLKHCYEPSSPSWVLISAEEERNTLRLIT